MEKVDTYTLLQHMELRLARIELRQAKTQRFCWGLLTLAAVLLAAAALWLTPRVLQMKADYDAAIQVVTQLHSAVDQVDLSALGETLQGLQQLGPHLLDRLDPASLENLAACLQALDANALSDTLAAMDGVDTQALASGLQQLQKLLQGLDGLDTEAINTAVQNLNRALEPLLRLFGKNG